MRRVFVDTSGFYAAIDETDPFHQQAFALFAKAEAEKWSLVTTNYIVHECWALIQRRLGWDGVEEFLTVLLPRCEVHFIGAEEYDRAAESCRQKRLRLLSLTDCVSLRFMSQQSLSEAIVFDKHFTAAGISHPG
jgi:predicted nucleic acid-binding protein